MRNVSAKSLAQLAAKRDTAPPGESVVKDSTDVLVAAVPTEALTAYTAVIGVVLAANIGTSYGAFRWSAYGAFIILAMLAPAMLANRNASATDKVIRKLPVPECLTAGIAAAAWGLVMPGNPLTMILKGNALVFTTTAILIGTAAIITLAAQQLGTANSKNPVPADGTASTAQKKGPQKVADAAAPTENTTAPAHNADVRTANGADPAESATTTAANGDKSTEELVLQ